MTHIRFATDILRRLGEELNPSPAEGVLELVKNAYDADANWCRVEIDNSDPSEPSIRIVDDGNGMTRDDLVSGWLVVGRSAKTKSGLTRRGRVPAGSKGLGRLAALRLGREARVTTVPASDPRTTVSLSIDWTRYDDARLVEDVELEIKKRTSKTESQHGSTIEIRGLRNVINESEVKRLARGLILLADPFGDDPAGFRPILASPEFSRFEELVATRYFDQAEFHLSARLRDGRVSAKLLDWKGRTLFRAKHEDIAPRGRESNRYAAPDCVFDMWVFILDKETFSTRSATLTEVQRWLREFGGVHVYENGLRVLPYGNPGNDWLDINLRRAQSPEERPSTNTSIGRVAVDDTGSALVQKTDRSGFIESDQFRELRGFCHDSLEWMARRRLDLAAQRRSAEKRDGRGRSRDARKALERVVQGAPKETRKKLEVAVSQFASATDREVRTLRKEVQLYRTLSTAGIMAATFAHESTGNPLKVIEADIQTIRRRVRKLVDPAKFEEELKDPVDRITRSAESLAGLGAATLRLLDNSKRRLGAVDVHAIIKTVLNMFEPFLVARAIEVRQRLLNGSPRLRGSDAALESIVTNLLSNSVRALESVTERDRVVQVTTELDGGRMALHFDDSGEGIRGIDVREIWLPGQTTRSDGTGFGLTIVRDSVLDMGGEVSAEVHGELGGAHLIVRLPIVGV